MTSARHTELQSASLSISEAARRIGFSVDTLRRWADDGKLASFRTPGNQRRFLPEDVDALILPSSSRPVDDSLISTGRVPLPSGDAA